MSMPFNSILPPFGGTQAHYHVETRGFPGAVGSQKAYDFTAFDGDGDILHHAAAAVALHKARGGQSLYRFLIFTGFGRRKVAFGFFCGLQGFF